MLLLVENRDDGQIRKGRNSPDEENNSYYLFLTTANLVRVMVKELRRHEKQRMAVERSHQFQEHGGELKKYFLPVDHCI